VVRPWVVRHAVVRRGVARSAADELLGLGCHRRGGLDIDQHADIWSVIFQFLAGANVIADIIFAPGTAFAIHLITLTGPDKQVIRVNPAEIISVREPRESFQGHFHPDTKCLVFTADGKFLAVTEDCDTVITRIEGAQEQ